MTANPVRVLYIAGLGRSGSTILEAALAQLPGAVGVGELVYLWKRGIRNDERCGCGTPFSDCPFWREVGQRAFGGWQNVDVDRVLELQAAVDDVRHVPRMLTAPTRRPLETDLAEYQDLYQRLYAAVADVSGADVVVDSSKITSLAYVLHDSPRIETRMVHILRDARGVAYSWTKRVRRPEITDPRADTKQSFMPTYRPSYMAMLYDGHHALLELLRLRGMPTTRVRYEDFAEDPLGTVERVAAFAGLPFDRDALRGDSEHSLRLEPGHTVSGNPARFHTGNVEVRKDEKWRTDMPPAQRRLVGVLAGPANLAYGYAGRGPLRAARTNPAPAAPATRPAPEPDLPSRPPSVGVVIPTHNRPEMVRRAIRSVLGQDYPGELEVVVVHDRSEPDHTLTELDPRGRVRVCRNDRTPGLAGGRNTGILSLDTDLVAFCDDDDEWQPGKLRPQVAALESEPEAEFATTAMVVEYEGRSTVRLAAKDRVGHADLLRSRMAMLHSSSFLARRAAFLDGIGLVDETLPGSMAEDWDLLLRAAARHPIVHVDEPLVRIHWGPTSYFAQDWQVRNEARLWMLDHHPGLAADPVAAALSYSKLAFGSAMLGARRDAVRWAWRSLRCDWRQPRAPLALGVAFGMIDGNWLTRTLNRRGHGI